MEPYDEFMQRGGRMEGVRTNRKVYKYVSGETGMTDTKKDEVVRD